jgi:hypothetical protein
MLLLFPCLCGCLTNHYKDHYGSQGSALLRVYAPYRKVESPKLRGVTQEDEVIAYMEEGYLPIGTSSFTAPH